MAFAACLLFLVLPAGLIFLFLGLLPVAVLGDQALYCDPVDQQSVIEQSVQSIATERISLGLYGITAASITPAWRRGDCCTAVQISEKTMLGLREAWEVTLRFKGACGGDINVILDANRCGYPALGAVEDRRLTCKPAEK